MSSDNEYWDGKEWEDHVFRLLQDRHGADNVQKVPSTHGGDCGIDFFCLSEGVVYQCYAVEEPVDIATRAQKQKTKITTDVGKFCNPAAGAAKLFAAHPVRRWILVVPRHNSRDVVQHAVRKAAGVQAKGLPYVQAGFEILVQDREAFDEASWQRRAERRVRIRPRIAPASPEAIAGINERLTVTLRDKLSVRITEVGALEDAVDESLRIFVQSQNAIEALRDSAPEAYEETVRITSERLRRLRVGSIGTGLDGEIDGLKSAILSAVPNLDPGTAETIAFGAVSGWLMLCPLRLN